MSPMNQSSTPDPTASDVVLRSLDDDGVLLLTLNRPERNNGWTISMEEAYFAALIDAANDPAVRVIVVTGAGKSFCPGVDLNVLSDAANKATSPGGSRRRYPMTLIREIPKPTIAAVNGAAAGVGFLHAACCDLRFAATTAKFTTSFARRGLPAEHGLSWILHRLVGSSHAADLLLSARVVLADEALQMGLVNRVVEPDELLPTALTYARDMARNCSPMSLASIKHQLYADHERDSEAARLDGLRLIAEHVESTDFAEGVNSFKEKRLPKFAGHAAELRVARSL
jgi:enoyl-CoA hydratase/carnithine racemase